MGSPKQERRLERVRVLLRTLNDVYPGPSAPRRPDLAGPAPSSRVPCDFCHRSGRVYAPAERRIRACPVCEGAGWRKRRKGDQEWDEMTGQLVATAATKLKPIPMSPARIDAEIGRLQALQVAREGDIDPDEAFGWERQRIRRDQEGSYRELERVLDRMQIDWPEGRSTLNSMYLTEPAVSYSATTELLLVAWVARHMPSAIRVPKRYHQALQARLKGDIRALAAEGHSHAFIAAQLEVPLRLVTGTLQVSFGTASGDRNASGPLAG